MFRRIIDRIKEAVEYLMSSRLIVLIIVFCLTSSILIGRLFYLQIVRGEDYLENYELQIRKTRTVPGTRGNIFDRNGEVIAYNELAYSVTIEDIIPTDTKTEDKNKILNDTLDSVLSIVEENGDSVIDNFGIILDSSGSYQFAETNETSRLRFVADVHGKSFIDDLTEKEKNKTAEQIVHYLCKRYGLDYSEHDAAYILKMVNMRYAMGLNSYQQWLTTVLASDVSDATAAAIMENQDSLQGVDISEDSLRRYPDGQYFASIIGYTGQISQEEYDDLSDDEKKRYSLSDIVGKSGIEHTFDSVLQGEKGKTTFYVDNLGKVTDTVSMTDPKAGNDVYLTIDKNLQISAYKLLEEKLAGIVLSKLSNVLDYDPSAEKDTKYIKIPVGDAYNSFIANEIIDMRLDHHILPAISDGQYFASIIGYTGQISQEEYDDLSDDEKKRYSLSDIVGKSGIEHTFDSVLQGEKGKTTFYVDNLGKVTDTVSMTDPKAGNDVYLTIDKNLQISAYKLLEEKLAGIVLSKLSNVLDYDPSAEKDTKYIKIPVGDAYNSFIANEIIDMKKFGRTDAKPAEQAVYNTFTQKKAEILSELMAQLQNENAPAYKDLSKEMKAYMDYICDTLLKQTTGILMSDKIEAEDETQIAWATQETISLNRYLNYAISKNWIDTSKLGDSAYSSSEEIYSGVLAYLEEYLKEDSNFDKLLYKYLIKSGSVTGAQICAIVYEQGVLPMDENAYNGLLNGTTDAYGWLYDKIKTLQITPGQLALEPCSGGIVVTDPNSGDVLACVSYPGYDNNRLANTMDSAYYNQLNTGRANIFYNRATQEKTAPGSTFKMISATAGLEEGYIDAYTTTYCSGSFNTVTPSPKCWIYPGGHGALNVVQSLQHSCNVFYYQLGYNMGINSNGNYDSDLGTDKLRKYAAMYGLDRKSGVEIPEAAPQISDEYSIQSAIGQGTNNFTVSQLNRYVTAVANSGTVYDLTLIDKTTDAAGNLIKDYSAEVDSTMDEINSSTWDLIHQGMEQMVASSTTFTGLDFSMAGKTGTAQHNELHADHVLFVGYAPAEQPQLSIAVRITYGYNSGYASEIGRDIAKVYFNPETAGELITGSAANLGEGIAGD